jgi:Leucine-rich repeat (LRR) protein
MVPRTTQSKATWTEDRALLRSNPSAVAGAKTGAGAEPSRSAPPLPSTFRDWHQSEKPSRHEAAKSSTGCASQLANANRPKFQFPLNQDRRTNTTDKGLKEVGRLKKLQYLDLSNLNITDDGLKELRNLIELKRLYVVNTWITDSGLINLTAFKNLDALDLRGTQVTDGGVAQLEQLKKLGWLGLSLTKVTESGLRSLEAALPEAHIVFSP